MNRRNISRRKNNPHHIVRYSYAAHHAGGIGTLSFVDAGTVPTGFWQILTHAPTQHSTMRTPEPTSHPQLSRKKYAPEKQRQKQRKIFLCFFYLKYEEIFEVSLP